MINEDENNFDIESSDIISAEEPQNKTLLENSNNIEKYLEPTYNLRQLGQWINSILPYLKPSGKPGALILTLGVASVLVSSPLLLFFISGDASIAFMIALGAIKIAILSVTGSIIIAILSSLQG
ncbi:MAG: hypothetical protein KAF91_14825 [Nostoc sp. TH1S01]|nr:hypothetical protein [Nostoc sp. TH1S01]